MPDGKYQPTRRTLLRGASIALVGGMAGCTTLGKFGSGNDDSGSETTSSQTTSSQTASTGTEGEATKTDESGSSNSGAESFPFLHPSTGTTNFGVGLDGSPVMGSDDAAIDMYYWTDYLCPYCQEFALDVHSKIARNEVKAGTLRIIYLELPFKTEKSWPAAILAKSVWHQVADSNPALYWDWSKKVFESFKSLDKSSDDLTKLYEITDSVGIDVAPVKQYMRSNKDQIKSEIETEKALADREKIPGTPGFLLFERETEATRKIPGVQPYSVYRRAVDALQQN